MTLEPDTTTRNKRLDYAMTHTEIAAELGMTKSAVHKAEKSALAKLRGRLEQSGFSASSLFNVLQAQINR